MRLQEIKTKPDEDMCMLAKGAKTKLNKIKDIGTTFIVKDVYKCFWKSIWNWRNIYRFL